MRPRVCVRCGLVNWPEWATGLPRLRCFRCSGLTVRV
jgi:hypothetical protein